MSAETTEMSDDDIAAILVHAREKNAGLGLTGALLYYRGRFIQILEGPADAVRARFARIAGDPRHRSVQIIRENSIAERQFPEWTMGFRPISDGEVKRLPGYNDFFDGHTGRARLEYANSASHQFLEWLAEYWFLPGSTSGSQR